ncbi:MAG: hypothetical protein LBB47_00005 [Spirochaetaceae bacterium]|nr:hypothetical protein [Spirochaetaceae bacterium]
MGEGNLVLTAVAGNNGAKLVITAGTGGVKAGATTITGEWQAVGTAGTVTIAATDTATSSITASANTVAFTAGTGGTITQAAEEDNNLLIGANTTIALGGDKDAAVGAIVLTGDNTNPAVLTLIGKITGETLTTPVDAGDIEIDNAVLADTNAITGLTDSGPNNNLGSLIGATENNTITAGGSSDDVTLNSEATITTYLLIPSGGVHSR